MPNIMDGIHRMKKDDLISQVASFKIITMSNVFSEMGQKASYGAVKTFNKLMKAFNAAPIKEPTVVRLEQRLEQCKSELNHKSQDELIDDMRFLLSEKVNTVSPLAFSSPTPSDDELSVCVIEAGCKNFKKTN